MAASVCAGCKSAILDKFLLTVLDKTWHADCVRCVVCNVAMETKCFSRDGQLYCRQDFFRQFGVKCSGCSLGISPDDFVRRTRDSVFHVTCFTCATCKREPDTGDELYLIGDGSNLFVCKEDYLAGKYHTLLLNGNYGNASTSSSSHILDSEPTLLGANSLDLTRDTNSAPSPFSSDHPSMDSLPNSISPSGMLGLRHPFHAPSSASSASKLHLENAFSDRCHVSRDFDAHAHQARSLLSVSRIVGGPVTAEVMGPAKNLKRHEKGLSRKDGQDGGDAQGVAKKRGPRTTIKAKQLETLKAAFLHSPKPTRHVREKLAAETSLSMRVIQVWFQNRRSKERRLRQLTGSGGSGVSQSSLRRPQLYRGHRRLAAVSDNFRLVASNWGRDSMQLDSKRGAGAGGAGGGGYGRHSNMLANYLQGTTS